jgi:hypothetical protein
MLNRLHLPNMYPLFLLQIQGQIGLIATMRVLKACHVNSIQRCVIAAPVKGFVFLQSHRRPARNFIRRQGSLNVTDVFELPALFFSKPKSNASEKLYAPPKNWYSTLRRSVDQCL